MERKVRDGLEEVETEMEDSPKCRERTRDENERLVRSVCVDPGTQQRSTDRETAPKYDWRSKTPLGTHQLRYGDDTPSAGSGIVF